ncbi:hypothetical protein HQN90_11015 [Paenibacillus alba]|uniref:hypothetical protein n=1 Tax=Paenibacillus alba TaxID=1197127 RepID=UPI00156641B3|nr:hypothetical protein [Paenibacillus alba]NQX66657.1 hypothetical protein [Paenibacillus alba]
MTTTVNQTTKKKLENLKLNKLKLAADIKTKKILMNNLLHYSSTMSEEIDFESLESQLLLQLMLKYRLEKKNLRLQIKTMKTNPRDSKDFEKSIKAFGIEETLQHINDSLNDAKFEYDEDSDKIVIT